MIATINAYTFKAKVISKLYSIGKQVSYFCHYKFSYTEENHYNPTSDCHHT